MESLIEVLNLTLGLKGSKCHSFVPKYKAGACSISPKRLEAQESKAHPSSVTHTPLKLSRQVLIAFARPLKLRAAEQTNVCVPIIKVLENFTIFQFTLSKQSPDCGASQF